MSVESHIIGIDLGTTFSAVSVVQHGRPVILSSGNERIIPSVVGYSPQGGWLVGTPARNQFIYAPESTVRSVKRKMGSGERFSLGGREFSPQEISAFILRELKRVAEVNLGQAVSRAVITVPAYFSDAQRQATKDAGRIAGLSVERILNEPTAAALAYGLDRAEDKMVLVYDLGGGTFDVSLVELTAGVVEVRASHGNTHLGGDDFDARLAESLARTFEEQHGVSLQGNRVAQARLTRAAEQAKIHLSDHPFARVQEEYLAERNGVPLHLDTEISRVGFEEMIEDLLLSTLDSVNRVLKDSQLAPGDVDMVLLVGGSTRIPAVWEMVANRVGIEPRMEINPDEAVALGAGAQAAIIQGVPLDAILVDVTPYSLGIQVAEQHWGQIVPDRYKVLIRRNTTIPTTKEEIFSTLFPDQTAVQIQVYQGESPVASENILLGKFLFEDLEPEQPGMHPRVAVQFDLDVNGILRVRAVDRGSGEEAGITVTASTQRLSEDEIAQARQRVDETESELPTLTTGVSPMLADEAEALIDRAEKILKSGKLIPHQAEALRAAVSNVTAARLFADPAGLQSALDVLLDRLFELEA